MKYIVSKIDTKKNRLESALVYDDVSKSCRLIDGFKRGNTLYNAYESHDVLSNIFNTEKTIVCNNYLDILRCLKINVLNNTIVYDCPFSVDDVGDKNSLAVCLKKMLGQYKDWMVYRANSSKVYNYLSNKGVILNDELVYPIWKNDTFSGRSKTVEHNIQGLTENDSLTNTNHDKIFINFDWISADIRVLALLSNDENLDNSFVNNDPYSYIIEQMNDQSIDRSQIKSVMLKSIYSFDYNSPILSPFPKLKSWIKNQSDLFDNNKYTESLFGRRFSIESADRSKLSCVNAGVQGSVALLMNIALYKIWLEYPESILLETHDSVTITSSSASDSKDKIECIGNIMANPIGEFRMPTNISIGKGYKKWQSVKRKS